MNEEFDQDIVMSENNKNKFELLYESLEKIDNEYSNLSSNDLREGVENIIRVEQGEYLICDSHNIKVVTRMAGTNNVNPCVVICIKTENKFSLIHFDSYSTKRDLKDILNLLQEKAEIIYILGGREGNDPLRTGTKSLDIVHEVLKDNLYTKDIDINYLYRIHQVKQESKNLTEYKNSLNRYSDNYLDCIFNYDGKIELNKFALGLGVKKNEITKEALIMRLIHSKRYIVTANQLVSRNYAPVQMENAYDGTEKSVFLNLFTIKSIYNYKKDIERSAKDNSNQEKTLIEWGCLHLAEEISKNRKYIVEYLNEKFPSRENIHDALIEFLPVFVGIDTEKDNEEIAKQIPKIIDNNLSNLKNIPNKVKSHFATTLHLPYLQELIPTIAQKYDLNKEELSNEFPDIENSIFAVDVSCNEIINSIEELNYKYKIARALSDDCKYSENDSLEKVLKDIAKLSNIDERDFIDKLICEYNNHMADIKNRENIYKSRPLDDAEKERCKKVFEEVLSEDRKTLRFVNIILDKIDASDPISLFEYIRDNRPLKEHVFENLLLKYNEKINTSVDEIFELSLTNISAIAFYNEKSPKHNKIMRVIKDIAKNILQSENIILPDLIKYNSFIDSIQECIENKELKSVEEILNKSYRSV